MRAGAWETLDPTAKIRLQRQIETLEAEIAEYERQLEQLAQRLSPASDKTAPTPDLFILPQEVGTLIGREAELAQIGQILCALSL